MRRSLITLAALAALTGPALAEGDAAKGEADFKKCKACHTIASDDEVIVKGGRTGPNLYGVVGRAAGSTDFKYSSGLLAAGEAGLVWTEDEIATYLADPTAYLREATGDDSARSKMTFKMKGGEDVAAYLASLSPEVESSEDGEASE
jgi:cytochrome c